MAGTTTDLIRGIERQTNSAAPMRISTSLSGLSRQRSLAALQLVAPAVAGNYTCGLRWLERIADGLDAADGSLVVAATHDDQFAGVAVLRPKGVRRLKIATFFVAPQWRGRGVATMLACQVTAGAFDAGYEKLALTCPDQLRHQFDRILVPGGFQHVDRLIHRYGERAENVFCAGA